MRVGRFSVADASLMGYVDTVGGSVLVSGPVAVTGSGTSFMTKLRVVR